MTGKEKRKKKIKNFIPDAPFVARYPSKDLTLHIKLLRTVNLRF